MRLPRILCKIALVLCAGACSAIGAPHAASAQVAPAQNAAPAQAAKAPPSTRDLYTKQETMIAMRDGVRLHTVIFMPKEGSKSYPILLTRTPYGTPGGADNFPQILGPSREFTDSGYIVAYQDVRGKDRSEGDFVNVRPELAEGHAAKAIDESTDAYDTIDWLVRSIPHNNGRVGMWGISYPGFYTTAGAIHAHPALKAVSPQAPVTDWFLGDDLNHNGAFFLMDDFAWDYTWGFDFPRDKQTPGTPPWQHTFPTHDAYQFYLDMGPLKNANAHYLQNAIPYWNEILAHDAYDDYWQSRSLLPHLSFIAPAVLTVGGWFDGEDYFGTLATFRWIARQSPATPNYLALGPWPHGGWSRGPGDRFGDLDFGSATGAYFRKEIQFPFFEYYLKGNGAPPAATAQVFLTGTNQWRTFDTWPPRGLHARALYLRADQTLASEAPPANPADTAFDAYVSDPASPVPYSAHAHTQSGRYIPSVVEDQRFLSKRTDVLTYRTAPLTEDMTVLGPITADLFVSTTGMDADFVVKIVDVYPDARKDTTSADERSLSGSEILVREQVFRGKFRSDFSKPEPFSPGVVTPLRFDLPDIGHTFRKGHRIEVQIQSSLFPLVDRNPQTFLHIPEANAEDFQKATIHIYRSDRYPSRVILGVQ